MAKQEQTSKKDKEKAEKAETAEIMSPEEKLHKSILDTVMNKYDVVVMARRWAYELQSKEAAGLSIQDAIEHSVGDILSGRVTSKELKELPPLRHVKKPKGVMGFLTEPLPKPAEGASASEAGGSESEGASKKDKAES